MKEGEAFKAMELSGQPLITHDDKLLVRAQKSDIGLDAEWKAQANITYKGGKPIIVNYCYDSPEGFKAASVDEWEGMQRQEQKLYRPQPLREIDLAEGVTVSFKNNQMDLRICNLFEDWRSRYRLALNHMIGLTDCGVIKYTPTTDPTEKNKQEAIRNRVKRYCKPTEYEHDILFRGELGRRLHRALTSKEKHAEGGTLYFQGYNRTDDTKVAVKYYDIGEREGLPKDEYFKLETTFLREYFKAEKISIANLTEQPEIQKKLLDALVCTVAKIVRLIPEEEQRGMAQALELDFTTVREAPARIARAMLSSERTLTKRVHELERVQAEHARVQAEHARRIAALERGNKR